MKKLVMFAMLIVFGFSFASAQTNCVLNAKLINQDPYPALPGEYVKVVFQLTGGESPGCGTLVFELIEEFPFSLDPEAEARIEVESGTYAKDFNSALIIPYEIVVHEDAIEGVNKIKVSYATIKGGSNAVFTNQEFDIQVEDVRTDFEISIKDFSRDTNTLTLEILNIGEHDAEALTIEIPKQNNIEIKGSNRNIVGSLDSNEDTTFNFEAIPRDGEIIVNLLYTDEINVRRSLEKIVKYDSSYFTDRKEDEKQPLSPTFYVLIVIAILIVLLWIRSWLKKRRKRKEMDHHRKRR